MSITDAISKPLFNEINVSLLIIELDNIIIEIALKTTACTNFRLTMIVTRAIVRGLVARTVLVRVTTEFLIYPPRRDNSIIIDKHQTRGHISLLRENTCLGEVPPDLSKPMS